MYKNRTALLVAGWLTMGFAVAQKAQLPISSKTDTLVVGSDTMLVRETVTTKIDTIRMGRLVPRDTSYWQRSFNGNITLNQASFNNWIGGGVNSVSLGGIINARGLYQKARWSWDNTADLQLGFIRQNGLARKASDQILLNSVVGYAISPHIDLFASGTFTTFFAPGYDYTRLAAGQQPFKISNFLAPGQLTTAVGIAYKPTDWLAIRLSPMAPRFTFLADQSVRYRLNADSQIVADPTATVYGVEPGQSIRREWTAFQLQAVAAKAIGRVNFSAKYLLYANYQHFDAIDHRIDLLLATNITKYLGVTFNLTALFDKDYSPDWQLQQTVGVGLTYTTSTFRKAK